MSDATRDRMVAINRAAGLATILLVVACGGISPIPDTSPRSPLASPALSDVSAPATVGPHRSTDPAPFQDLLVRVGDDERRVRVFAPHPAPSEKLPLLIFLHAFGETPATAIRDTRFDELAASGAAVVAFPPASGRAWEAQVTNGLADSDVDEVFLGGLVDQLADGYPIDPERVYVAGFSMGAVMAGRLACRLADRIAAVVIASGTPWIGDCRPSRPVSVLIVHGTGDGTFRYDKAVQMAEAWRTRDRCPSAASPEPVAGGASVTTSRGCAGGSIVSFISVTNGRHVWFTEPDATKLAWAFLAERGRE